MDTVKVRVIKKHLGEGGFPTFKKGTKVRLEEPCMRYANWYSCNIEGYQTYVPNTFVCEGLLIRDYNPTELMQEVGDILEVQEIVHAWLIATSKKKVTGWIPAEIVMSVNN